MSDDRLSDKQERVIIPAGVILPGDLVVPRVPRGFVVFAHGGGSSQFGLSNRRVAEHLQTNGFATFSSLEETICRRWW